MTLSYLCLPISFRAANGGGLDRRGKISLNLFRDGNIRWPFLNLCVICKWNLFGGQIAHTKKSDYFVVSEKLDHNNIKFNLYTTSHNETCYIKQHIPQGWLGLF